MLKHQRWLLYTPMQTNISNSPRSIAQKQWCSWPHLGSLGGGPAVSFSNPFTVGFNKTCCTGLQEKRKRKEKITSRGYSDQYGRLL